MSRRKAVTKQERESKDSEVADFRYSVVADLANPYLDGPKLRQLLREKADRVWEVPDRGRRRLSEGCIRKWLTLYRKCGKKGLEPKRRQDAGRPRALSQIEAALLLTHLETHPELTASSVLKKLQNEGKIKSFPSTSSLSRLVRSAGLQREKRLRRSQEEQNLKFDFFAPLECVQADCMYAMKIPDEKGKLRHALLMAFLDDATRRVVYATFSFSESSLCFEAGIKHILCAHGKIGRLYVDNGSSFVGTQTKRILDTLGIVLIHSRPYKPAGRGKIERFFRTAREQFFRLQDPASIPNLSILDARFHSWLESEYHRSPHRGLGNKTPLDVWLEKARHIIPIDPLMLESEELFFHQVSRKVYRDSTVTLDGVLFEVPSSLIGERINLYYDPHLAPQRRRLLIHHQGSRLGEARVVDSYANAHVRRGELNRDVLVQEVQSDSKITPSAPTPVDASLAASRLDLSKEGSK
jgi:transposase